jgi:hypothetical protein
MDTSELTRAVIGLPVAAVVPAFLPGRLGWLRRAVFACALAAWAVGPWLDEWRGALLVVLAVGGSLAIAPSRAAGEGSLLRAALCTLALVTAAGLLIDSRMSVDAVDATASDGDVFVVAAGALVAIFVGGAAIGRLLAPFADRMQPTNSEELASAGLVIGWLERALLFGFVVSGAPTGVALVVAAKSLARLPSLSQKDRFAEYFLIGTLASVLIAVGVGVAVRAILGLTPPLA